MKRHYVKIFSVASIVAGLFAANASYAKSVAVTPAGAVDVQSDFNEDVPRHPEPAKNPALDPNFNLLSEVNKVDIDFMATIEARYSLYDQTREQNFDFLNQLALFGVHMWKDNWTADLLVRFSGQYLRNSHFGDPYDNPEYTQPVDSVGLVGIRKASIGYKLYRNDHNLVKFTLGRFAPFGQTAYDDDSIVRAWGTDATVNLWGPNGTGNLHGIYVDGASLSWQGKWNHHRFNMAASVASDLPQFLYLLDSAGQFNIHENPYQVFGNDASFGHLSTNASRAWLVNASYMYSANWGDVQAAIDAAGKTRAETEYTGFGDVGDTAYAYDTYYIGASLGYTMQDKMAVGAWYNWTHTSDEQFGGITAPDNAVNEYIKAPSFVPAGNYTVFGVGINGSSKWWKQHDVGGKGGVITWGGGYERFMTRDGFNASTITPSGASAEKDVNLYSLALGWARGPVTAEIDWALFSAEDKVLYNGDDKVSNGANVVYLVGTFDI